MRRAFCRLRPYQAAVVAAALLAGLLLAPSGAAAQPPNEQANCGPLSEPAGVQNPNLNASVPVVLLHGILSSATKWDEAAADDGLNLAQSLAYHLKSSVWAFDYESANREWVDDPAIGPRLVTTIRCLHDVSGTKVILIAHSNGGNAIRYALGEEDVIDMVAHVTTIATPFEGSELAGAAYDAVVSRCAQGSLSACLAAAYGASQYPVTAALRPGSAALAALPPWPDGVQAFKIAGSIQLIINGAPVYAGDLAMSRYSALSARAPAARDPLLLECGPMGIVAAPRSRCSHGNIPKDGQVIEAVRTEVFPIIDALVPEPEPPVDSGLGDRAYFVECPGSPGTYQLTDGQHQGEFVTIELVYEQLIDLNGNGRDDAVVILNCYEGANGHRGNLYVLQAGRVSNNGYTGWITRASKDRYLIVPIGDPDDAIFAGHDPRHRSDDPNCCPSEYMQWRWQADLNSDEILVEIQGPTLIDSEDVPPRPW